MLDDQPSKKKAKTVAAVLKDNHLNFSIRTRNENEASHLNLKLSSYACVKRVSCLPKC